MARVVLMFPLAVLLSLGLFFSIYQMAGLGKVNKPERTPPVQFDFLQVRDDSRTTLLERDRPEPPPETKPQPTPQMPNFNTPQVQQLDTPKLQVEMPHIELGLSLNIQPSLAGLQAPAMPMTVDRNAIPLVRVPPRYPRRAISRGIEGSVTVEFTVQPDGHVQPGSIKVLESKPQGVFDSAVKRSIMRWRFKSRTKGGKPVSFRAQQTLEFKLEK